MKEQCKKHCFCADDELPSQAKKKKAKTAKGRKEYIPNKGDANWVVVLMLLKVANLAMHACTCCTITERMLDKSLAPLPRPSHLEMMLHALCSVQVVICTCPEAQYQDMHNSKLNQ